MAFKLMNYNIIATGSTGNAVVVNDYILIDCGVSFKALKDVYKKLKIVLLTHIHGDHFNATTIRKLAEERPTLYFACCKWLVADLVACNVPKRNIFVLEVGKLYNFGACKVSPVKLYHDVPNAGYRIFIGDEKALYATDTGHLQGIVAKDYSLYLIEANYDENEIEQRIIEKTAAGQYCYELGVKDRHLSHEQASEWLMQNMGQKSEYVFLHQHKDKKKPQEWEYTDE